MIVLKVEGILQLFGLLSCGFLQLRELELAFFDDSIDVHQAVIIKDLLLLLQDLGSAVKQYFLILILGQRFLSCDFSRLYDYRVDLELNRLTLQDHLFHRGFGDQSVDIDLLFLAYTVRAVHGLDVRLGVPIRVIEYNVVSCH